MLDKMIVGVMNLNARVVANVDGWMNRWTAEQTYRKLDAYTAPAY